MLVAGRRVSYRLVLFGGRGVEEGLWSCLTKCSLEDLLVAVRLDYALEGFRVGSPNKVVGRTSSMGNSLCVEEWQLTVSNYLEGVAVSSTCYQTDE